MNSPVRILTSGGRGDGETTLFLKCDQKRDQAKSKALEAREFRTHKTLTPRFTDFFTDFEKYTDCFGVYSLPY